MSDWTDEATRTQEILLEAELQASRNAARQHAATVAAAAGKCFNCQEPLEDKARHFCDKDCQQDFERRARPRR